MKVSHQVSMWQKMCWAEARTLTSQRPRCCGDPGRAPVRSSGTEEGHWDMRHRRPTTKPVTQKHEKHPWVYLIWTQVVELKTQERSVGKLMYLIYVGKAGFQFMLNLYVRSRHVSCQTENKTVNFMRRCLKIQTSVQPQTKRRTECLVANILLCILYILLVNDTWDNH